MALRDFLHPIRRLKETIGLYDNLVYTNMVKNDTSEVVKMQADDDHIAVDQMGMYQDNSVTFFYLLEQLPNFLHVDFKTRLRRECKGDTRIIFINRISPHKIAWNSPEMQSKLRILSNNASEVESQNVTAFNMHSELSAVRRNEWIQESLQYLTTADVDRNRALFKMSMLVMVTGTRGEDFDASVKSIEAYAEHLGITLTRVLYNIPEVLAYFSPWGQKLINDNRASYPTFVVPDEILARFNTYSQGTLGKAGISFGVDIYSMFPVLKKVKATREDAENWLISAETGGGKSYFVKSLLLQLLAQGYNGTIMDVEGFEYLPMAKMLSNSLSVRVINMAEGQGGYFDPVEIPIYSAATLEEATQLRQNSLEFTLSIMRVLLGQAYNEDVYLSVVLDDAVSAAYRKRGVTSNRMTWENSRGMTLYDVYASLKDLQSSDSHNDDYLNALEKAIALTGKYFEPSGTRSSLFKNRISVGDIIDADLVICSFGMAGKSQTTVDEVQMALMQLGAAQLSHQRSVFSKNKGKFNFKLWEEFQRWGKFPGSDKTLGVALTGGRKLGDVNIIITNVIAELLGEDRFNVFSNVTSFLIGAINDSKVRAEACERLSVPHMLPELNAISTVRSGKDEETGTHKQESIYRYSFLCGLDKTKYAITKVMLPPNLAKSELFRTGVESDMDKQEQE